MAKDYEVNVTVNGEDNTAGKFGDIEGSMDTWLEQSKEVAIAFAAMGAAITTGLGFAVKAAAESEEVYAHLKAQVEVTGNSWADAKPKIDDFTESIMATTKYGDEETARVLQRLFIFTSDLGEAMKGTKLAMDMAASGMFDVDQAARLVGMAMNGNTEILGRFLPEFKAANNESLKSMDANEKAAYALDVLQKKFGGLSDKELNDFNGQMQQLGNYFGEVAENIGFALIPALTEISKSMTGLSKDIKEFTKNNEELTKIVTILVGSFGGLSLAVSALILAAPGLAVIFANLGAIVAVGGPLLLGLAAVSLALAGIYTFWNQLKDLFAKDIVLEESLKSLTKPGAWDEYLNNLFDAIDKQKKAIVVLTKEEQVNLNTNKIKARSSTFPIDSIFGNTFTSGVDQKTVEMVDTMRHALIEKGPDIGKTLSDAIDKGKPFDNLLAQIDLTISLIQAKMRYVGLGEQITYSLDAGWDAYAAHLPTFGAMVEDFAIHLRRTIDREVSQSIFDFLREGSFTFKHGWKMIVEISQETIKKMFETKVIDKAIGALVQFVVDEFTGEKNKEKGFARILKAFSNIWDDLVSGVDTIWGGITWLVSWVVGKFTDKDTGIGAGISNDIFLSIGDMLTTNKTWPAINLFSSFFHPVGSSILGFIEDTLTTYKTWPAINLFSSFFHPVGSSILGFIEDTLTTNKTWPAINLFSSFFHPVGSEILGFIEDTLTTNKTWPAINLFSTFFHPVGSEILGFIEDTLTTNKTWPAINLFSTFFHPVGSEILGFIEDTLTTNKTWPAINLFSTFFHPVGSEILGFIEDTLTTNKTWPAINLFSSFFHVIADGPKSISYYIELGLSSSTTLNAVSSFGSMFSTMGTNFISDIATGLGKISSFNSNDPTKTNTSHTTQWYEDILKIGLQFFSQSWIKSQIEEAQGERRNLIIKGSAGTITYNDVIGVYGDYAEQWMRYKYISDLYQGANFSVNTLTALSEYWKSNSAIEARDVAYKFEQSGGILTFLTEELKKLILQTTPQVYSNPILDALLDTANKQYRSNIISFDTGGIIPSNGLFLGHKGEGVLNQRAMERFGESGLSAINKGAAPAQTITIIIQAWDGADVERVVKNKVVPILKNISEAGVTVIHENGIRKQRMA
jgi:hypothetical protein